VIEQVTAWSGALASRCGSLFALLYVKITPQQKEKSSGHLLFELNLSPELDSIGVVDYSEAGTVERFCRRRRLGID
jgi:hypothetical protein